MWKDSTGTVVPIVTLTDLPYGSVLFTDAAGWIWVQHFSGVTAASLGSTSIWYSQTNCTGTAYLMMGGYTLARGTFRVAGSGYYGIPDNFQPQTMAFASSWVNGACSNSAGTGPLIPLSTAVSIATLPAPPGTPPYHPEYVP